MEEESEGGNGGTETKAESNAPPARKGEETAQSDVPLRDNMVDLATRFLTNSRVQTSPLNQRRAFLKKKGLTDAEVDKAVQQAEQQGALAPASTNQNAVISRPVGAPPLPPRPPALPPRERSWSEYAVMVAVVGGIGYAVVYFVRCYLIPWFQSPKVQEQRLSSIQSSVDQLQSSITETVTSVNQSTQAIRDLLSEQQQNLQLLSTQVSTLQSTLSRQQTNGQPLKDIKDELASLKGLLLSRHQFPPTPSRPATQSGIPAWQRVQLQPSTPSGLKPPHDQQNGLILTHTSSSTESSPAPVANGGCGSMAVGGPGTVEDPVDSLSQSRLSQGEQVAQVAELKADSEEQWHDVDD